MYQRSSALMYLIVDDIVDVVDDNEAPKIEKKSGDRYSSIAMQETLGEMRDENEPDDNITRDMW